MKKSINIRIPLVCVLALCLGIFCFREVLFGNWWAFAVCCAFPIVLGVVFACLGKKYWIVCLVALAFVILGFCDFYAAYGNRNEQQTSVQFGVISGRVTDLGRNGAELNVVYLEDCTFEGKKLKGRVMVYVYDGSAFSTGNNVSATGTLVNAYAVKSQTETYYIRNNVCYQLVDSDNWIIQSGELTLSERVREFVYKTVSAAMPQNCDVAYALLTGDRNALDESKKDNFTDAGIIHLLVVSGLHVGFVVSVFGFVLKRLKIHPAAELAILVVPLIFYAYVCDFAPSVVRAVVMTVCVYLSKLLRGRYDLLTSLCVAALVILLIQPIYLFDVGFQLSVLSVYGIATLFLQAERWASRRKMPKPLRKLFQTVAMSVSCVAATMFLSAYVFQSFVWLGVLVNILAIPLVFVSFVLGMIGLIPGVFRYALWLSDEILQVVVNVADSVSSWQLTLPLKTSVWAIFVSLALLFVVGGYVNLSQKGKYWVLGTGLAVLALCVGTAYIRQNPSNNIYVHCEFETSSFVATSQSGEAAIVCSPDAYNCNFVVQCLSDKKLKSCTLYVTDSQNVDVASFEQLNDNFHIAKVYLLDRGFNDQFEQKLSELNIPLVRAEFNKIYGNDVTVQSVYDGGFAGAVIRVGKISVALAEGGEEKTRHFAEIRSDVDFYALTCAQQTYAERGLKTFSRYQSDVLGNFGANKYGNFTIGEKAGIITLNFWGN